MSTKNEYCEAYVIEDDGTKTAIPVSFVDNSTGAKAKANAKGDRASQRKNARFSVRGAQAYYAPNSPFTSVDATTVAQPRSLHLGRRILGLGIAAIGVPLLILPGPGLALIGLGLLMVVMP